MIRVVIVVGDAIVRSGLRLIVEAEADIEVVGEAAEARDAVFELRAGKPDVVLLDANLSGEGNVDALLRLLPEAPGAQVIVLATQEDPSLARGALGAGARGYVLRQGSETDVVAAIREVAAGNQYVHPALGARIVAAEAAELAAAEADPLTDREREVLRLLALGHTNQEIAQRLYISVRTAESHRANIMGKLKLSNRAALVRYAIENGQLERDQI